MHTVDNILNTKSFIEFIKEVRTFCDFIESKSTMDGRSFLTQTQNYLQKLYLLGQQLQVVDLYFNKDFGNLLSEPELKDILDSISDRLGSKTIYWIIFDPTDENETEPVCGDLLDDVGSVYEDLKNALLLFDKEAPAEIENAIWSFKSSFDIHWNAHCINAIYALHYFIQHAA